MPQKQEKFVCMEINFVLRKNEGHLPSSLGGRLIVVFRQAGRQAGGGVGRQVGRCNTCSLQIFKIPQLQF